MLFSYFNNNNCYKTLIRFGVGADNMNQVSGEFTVNYTSLVNNSPPVMTRSSYINVRVPAQQERPNIYVNSITVVLFHHPGM